MTCPGPDIEACIDDVPCRSCSAVCPHCGDTWQSHVEGNACSDPSAAVPWDVTRTSDRLWIGVKP